MPTPSWDDLDQFTDPDDFGVRAVVQLQAGGPPLRIPGGVFDDPYLNTQLGEYEPDTAAPRYVCKESTVAAVRRGDTLRLVDAQWQPLDGITYDVLHAPEPDGTGMATIRLAKPPPAMR